MSEREDHHAEIAELIPAYVLGALEPDEIEAVELHLVGCAACRAQVEAERRVAGLLPYLAEPRPVPVRARRQLLARIDAIAPVAPPARRRLPAPLARFGWVAAIAAVLVAALLGINSLRMQEQVKQKDLELTAAQENQRSVARFVGSPRGFVTALQSTGVAPAAQGGVILDPTRNAALLMVDGLPKPPPGQAYVVWMVRGNQHFNVGVLPIADDGRATLYISPPDALASYDGILVTEESGPLAANPRGVRMMSARVEP
ncbi:MAG: anti-sigma factor [Sphaerobacter sp.]|nr:anti-sigma factor [Sphaerobacter sp.]